MAMPVKDLLKLITTALEDMKGKDIVQLDVRGLSNVTDYMVIATGSSNRHVKSLADEVSYQAKQISQGTKLCFSELRHLRKFYQ